MSVFFLKQTKRKKEVGARPGEKRLQKYQKCENKGS